MEEKKKEIQVSTSKDQPKVQKVVKNPAKVKKKSKFAKFVESFFIEDVKSVWSWAISDVAIPALKRLFVEFIDNTASSMVYGKGSSDYRRSRPVVGDNVSYRSYYRDDRAVKKYNSYDERHSEIYSYGTVEVDTEKEARDALDQMSDIIAQYRIVTVAQFLEMLDLHPRSTDFNWGWTSIAGARIVRKMNGAYEIVLPKVMQID